MSSGATAATLNTSSMVSFTPGNATCCLVLSLAHLRNYEINAPIPIEKRTLTKLLNVK